jgi:hypothetical protein
VTLPGSGSISLAQIATELGRTGTSVSLNQSDVAALAGKTTAQAIAVPNDFWGKSAAAPATYNFNESDYLSDHSFDNTATITLTCSQNATWTVTRTGSVNGSPITGSYAGTTLTFSLPYYGSNANASWSVAATAPGGNRNCTVALSVGQLG